MTFSLVSTTISHEFTWNGEVDEDGENTDNEEPKLTLGLDGVHDISSGKYISLSMEVSLLILAI